MSQADLLPLPAPTGPTAPVLPAGGTAPVPIPTGSNVAGAAAIHPLTDATLALHGRTGTGPGKGYVHQLAAITGWTSVRCLRTLRQPTLILAGDDDPLVPLINARILRTLIPNARVHVYSGGHVELVADPQRLVPTIEDFLSSDDAATDVSGRGRHGRWTGAPPRRG